MKVVPENACKTTIERTITQYQEQAKTTTKFKARDGPKTFPIMAGSSSSSSSARKGVRTDRLQT